MSYRLQVRPAAEADVAEAARPRGRKSFRFPRHSSPP